MQCKCRFINSKRQGPHFKCRREDWEKAPEGQERTAALGRLRSLECRKELRAAHQRYAWQLEFVGAVPGKQEEGARVFRAWASAAAVEDARELVERAFHVQHFRSIVRHEASKILAWEEVGNDAG